MWQKTKRDTLELLGAWRAMTKSLTRAMSADRVDDKVDRVIGCRMNMGGEELKAGSERDRAVFLPYPKFM